MDRLDNSSSKHFLYLLSESLLKMDRYGSVGCLFRCNGWICMDMIWLTWESAMPLKSSGYCSLICSFDLMILTFDLMILTFFSVSSQGIMGLEVVIMDSEFEFGLTSFMLCCHCVDIDCACISF